MPSWSIYLRNTTLDFGYGLAFLGIYGCPPVWRRAVSLAVIEMTTFLRPCTCWHYGMCLMAWWSSCCTYGGLNMLSEF